MAIIDDFEDGDLSEYTKSVPSGSITADTVASRDGMYGLLLSGSDFGSNSAHSTSGLSTYPSSGDTFEVYLQRTSSWTGARVYIRWAVDTESSPSNYYQVEVSDSFTNFDKTIDGSSSNLASDSTLSLSADTWYRVKVEWGGSGSFTITCFDPNSNQEFQLSATDTSHSSGGIGFRTYYGDDGSNDTHFDTFQTVGGSAPSAPSNLSATLS